MAPKGKSKMPPKARTPTLIDGLTKEEISKEQMEEHIVHLREELDREREERNYFQLEKDKIHTFWKITERQLEVLQAEQKKLDKDIEDDEGRYQVEIKVYKQKMKHLLCEHQNTISELKANSLVSTQAMQKEQEKLETELHKEKKGIMVEEQELNYDILLKELKLKHDEEMTKARNTWKKQLTEIKAKYERKMELLPQELDNMRRSEMSEREDHWNTHMATLIDNHNKAFGETDGLVNCMREDVDLVDSLKKQIKDMSLKQKEKEKDCGSLVQDNKCLEELLSKLKEEIAENEKKIHHYRMKKDTREKLKRQELNRLKSANEALETTFKKMQQEKDELYKAFTQNIQLVQDKGVERIVLQEEKLKALTDSLEKTQPQLPCVISASNLDPTALSGVTNQIEEKTEFLQEHKDLLQTSEAKQGALGIPVEDIHVKLLEMSHLKRLMGPDQDPEKTPKQTERQ
ncbi:dynein regulatory complex subunit 4 isoform X1 [Antennarius striatus]|uniref:dynein regulatory complex subunit 4 isoform X1 n=1 Tax=Antennarius striatus TaxID=241820 RepID=UPI0035B03BB9